MKKRIVPIYLMSLFAQGAFSGTMGPVVTNDYFVPFVAGEATVTWNTIQSATVFGTPPTLNKQLWGGRGALGLAHTSITRWGYTLEMGWGYYGGTTSTVAGTSTSGSLAITNSSGLYGFDMLVGLTYDYNPVQLFLKGGAMAENRRVNGYAAFNTTNPNTGTPYLSTNAIKTVSTNVLPEIKVGGLYALNSNLSLSLAYMHVFGNDNFAATVTGAFSNPAAGAGTSSVVNAQNPSLNSILFGLTYQFK